MDGLPLAFSREKSSKRHAPFNGNLSKQWSCPKVAKTLQSAQAFMFSEVVWRFSEP